jgi:hypothetical protein
MPVADRQAKAYRAQVRGQVAGACAGAVLWLDAGHIRQEDGTSLRTPAGDQPATEAKMRAEQMARLREEMRRREVEG